MPFEIFALPVTIFFIIGIINGLKKTKEDET
jgi:hypothetical protein